MIRSMASAISGLRNHQMMLEVTGNDIANVSTVGFKSSSTVFSDVLTQTLRGATAASELAGGTNPAQIGLGSRLSGTVQSFAQGAIQSTGRTTDVAIQGDGFFVVQNVGENLYTRNGSFTLDANGNLTTLDGMRVQGWQAVAGEVDPNGVLGDVQIRVGELLPPVETDEVTIGGNLDADAAVGSEVSISVTGYDVGGAPVQVALSFEKNATADVWDVSSDVGTPPVAATIAGAGGGGNNELTFGTNGELTVPAGRTITLTSAAFTGPITIDLGGAAEAGRITQYAGSGSITATSQSGAPTGTLQSFNVAQDGTIVGNYSNGLSQAIGQVGLAVFANPGGLERIAGVWRGSPNSGLPQVGIAASGGRGLVLAGSLEMSNVDLAEEFTRLIIAQRGFQGNARVITTSDEILQEVVNLRR